MLDEFSTVNLGASKPEPAAATTQAPASPKPAAASVADEPEFGEDEFAKQLQAGMANLLEGLADTVRSTSLPCPPLPSRPLIPPKPEMQAQFESIFKELGAAASESADIASTPAAAPAPSGTGGTASPSAQPTEASFQDTIRRTMERMQTSGEQATAAAAAEGTDDFLAELLKQMGSGAGGMGLDGGEGGEEEFSQMLMGMMEQLTNKEILYEPMKELHDKFPGWLDKNRDKTPAEELARYETQRALVRDIVGKFEEPTYSDGNKADREFIVDKMQQVSLPLFPEHRILVSR